MSRYSLTTVNSGVCSLTVESWPCGLIEAYIKVRLELGSSENRILTIGKELKLFFMLQTICTLTGFDGTVNAGTRGQKYVE